MVPWLSWRKVGQGVLARPGLVVWTAISWAVPGRPPSAEYPLGTDSQGRDLLAVMIAGTPLTVYMGLVAGFLGRDASAVHGILFWFGVGDSPR